MNGKRPVAESRHQGPALPCQAAVLVHLDRNKKVSQKSQCKKLIVLAAAAARFPLKDALHTRTCGYHTMPRAREHGQGQMCGCSKSETRETSHCLRFFRPNRCTRPFSHCRCHWWASSFWVGMGVDVGQIVSRLSKRQLCGSAQKEKEQEPKIPGSCIVGQVQLSQEVGRERLQIAMLGGQVTRGPGAVIRRLRGRGCAACPNLNVVVEAIQSCMHSFIHSFVRSFIHSASEPPPSFPRTCCWQSILSPSYAQCQRCCRHCTAQHCMALRQNQTRERWFHLLAEEEREVCGR